MRLRIEPKEFFMYSVFLAFSKASPDGEDTPVKEYLAQWELEPKAQGTDVIDGEDFDVMYFGGCYLGKHLDKIGEMQRTAVEQDMLTAAIEDALDASADEAARAVADATPEPRRREIIQDMVQELHSDSPFVDGDDGYMKVSLEPAVIQQKFLELARHQA